MKNLQSFSAGYVVLFQKYCLGSAGIGGVERFLSAREKSESVKVIGAVTEGCFEVGHGVNGLAVHFCHDFSSGYTEVHVTGVFEHFRKYDGFSARQFFGLVTAEEELVMSSRTNALAQEIGRAHV
jgi:hypothetical protein